MFCPVFESTDGKSIDIQELKLIGAIGDGSETIQPIGVKGNYVGDPYTWYSKENASLFGGTKAGWYDSSANLIEFPLVLGNSVYISVTTPADGYDAIKIQTSGGVKLTAIPKTLSAGINIVGNSSPTSQDIQAFKLKYAIGDGSETIQPIGTKGNYVGDPYTWYSEENASLFGGTKAGWYDSSANLVELPYAPGQGIYISVVSDVEIEIPAATSK